ncbi:VOC family protein [Nocardia transvalensis]|uniref:VOC family protein n=1 Tax=Nocardia transvalensis TaxID=37333 RepID=UPI0018945DEA|nr:VOC family protein [Nocardia transvalensis]MBF6333379.1 VOC family protein [Nocardia transvalensis]
MAPTLENIAFDCTDAAALAGFWSQLLDKPVDPDATEFFASIGRGTMSPTLMFLKVPERNPGKNVVHLDLVAPDWREQIERAVSLGAKHVDDHDEYGIQWATLADPEGNLFDIAKAERA